MDLLIKLFEFLQDHRILASGVALWAAFLLIVDSIRAFLVILAPLTETKIDDNMAGWISKIYDVLGKTISHKNPKKVEEKD